MSKKWIYWTPRILSIIFILFLSLFALDVFEEGLGFWMTVLALLIHLIPSFILVIILIISWKHELVGGISFIVLAVIFTFFFKTYENIFSILFISFIPLIIGILWILNWKKKRGSKRKKR